MNRQTILLPVLALVLGGCGTTRIETNPILGEQVDSDGNRVNYIPAGEYLERRAEKIGSRETIGMGLDLKISGGGDNQPVETKPISAATLQKAMVPGR